MVKNVILSLGVVGLLVLGEGAVLQGSGPTSQQERFVARVPQDFPTIQAAIDAVAEGGTVLIGPGTYQETLKITKSLRLKGTSQESVRIQAVDHGSVTIEIAAERPIQVSLEDFTVEAREFLESTGIFVWGDAQVLMKHLTVSGYREGVVLQQPLAVVLAMSTISRNRTGITVLDFHSREGFNVTIQDATITDNVKGISAGLFWAGHLVVRQSLLAWNKEVAFQLLGGWFGGSVATLDRNKITQNMSGIHLGFDRSPGWTEILLKDQPEPGPRVITIYKNQVIENVSYGIALMTEECPEIRLPLTTRRGNAFIGSENEIRDNGKGDLCPADYPWPPGFRK